MPTKNRHTPLGPTTTLSRSHAYSAHAMALFDQLLPEVRAEFIRDSQDPTNFEGEVLVGRRTMNDTDVEMTLKCGVPEDQFLMAPLTHLYDALQACAEKDWCFNEKHMGSLADLADAPHQDEVARVVED